MIRMLNLDSPFFYPLWRRVATLFVAFGWSLYEFAGGGIFWGLVFGALGGAAAWQFYTINWAKYGQADGED